LGSPRRSPRVPSTSECRVSKSQHHQKSLLAGESVTTGHAGSNLEPLLSWPSGEARESGCGTWYRGQSYGLDKTPALLVLQSTGYPQPPDFWFFLIEGGLYSVTALRETWARRRCILNTRIYHKQAIATSKAHFTRGSSSSSGSHSASSASVASSLCGVLRFRGFVLVRRKWAVTARPAWPLA